ncbi:MAG: hypothetical protein NTW28_23200 [Candidatus Solibacter sp.]|nr:hypothetical protein [Candidatus Solibacter sp.]
MNQISASAIGAADDFVAVSVFPKHEDHAVLRSIFRSSDRPLCPGSSWALKACTTLDEALLILKKGGIPLVLCECDLQPGSWKELLSAMEALPDPPYLIVTSRHADDRLWAEALNLGAYDVLPAPFDAAEVMRTLSVAWLRWNDREKPQASRLAKSAA